MKTYRRSVSLLLLITIALITSCQKDFLDQDPKTSLSTEQLFASLDNVQPFLNGLYTKFRNTRVNRKGFFLMLGTDECQQGEYQVRTDADQAGFDKYDGFMEPNNKPVAELWNIRWPIVVQASEAIANLEGKLASATKEDSASIRSYIGQACFYRGAVLLELASYWGELPIPTVDGGKIFLSGRKPLAEVYQLIESDFTTAAAMLGAKTGTDIRIPTSWAAKALLGKMYMSAPVESGLQDFEKALVQFEDIFQKGGFVLAAKFSDLWDPSKVQERKLFLLFYSTMYGPIPMNHSGILVPGHALGIPQITWEDMIYCCQLLIVGPMLAWEAFGNLVMFVKWKVFDTIL
jgi:starch-binding outer membrane protein, SusD/RagB family